jgi:hypothetical protein
MNGREMARAIKLKRDRFICNEKPSCPTDLCNRLERMRSLHVATGVATMQGFAGARDLVRPDVAFGIS